MNASGARRRRPAVVIGALLVLLVVAVFARVGNHPFASLDDNVYLFDNLDVRDGLSLRGTIWAFTTMHAANWHPLTWLSHMLDVELFGMDPGRHHLTSLALHAASAALLFLALRAMTGALWASALVAALFGVHPLHVESVAWLAERKDVLSTLFWMLALLAWVRYARRPSAGRYLVAAALFALGLLAKPMLVTLPLVLLLLDAWPLGRMGAGWHRCPLPRSRPRPAARRAALLFGEKVPLLALSAAASTMTLIAQRKAGAVKTLWMIPLDERVGNALVSYLRYLGKAAWPSGLGLFYPYAGNELPAWPAAAAGIALAGATVATLLVWRRHPYLAVGWLWYLGTLVPVIGLVQVGDQAMADRYTYVPLIGIFLAVVWAGAAWGAQRLAVRAALAWGTAAACAAFAVVAWFQVEHWKDNQALLGNAIAVTEKNWLAQMNLGVTLYQQGRFEEAIARYEEARRIRPMYADVHYNLGLAYNALRRYEEALAAYTIAASQRPGDSDTQNNLGTTLGYLGRIEEALAHYREAARLKPDDDLVFDNIGTVLAQLGRHAEATAARREAHRIREARRAAHPSLGRDASRGSGGGALR